MTFTVGQRVQLTDHVGYTPDHDPEDPAELYLNRHHPVFKDQVGTVDELIPAGVLVGPDGESPEHIGVCFDEHHIFDDHGSPDDGPSHHHDPDHGPRRVSFSVEDADRLFTEVTE